MPRKNTKNNGGLNLKVWINPPNTIRAPQLKDISDVAAFLAKLIREVYRGELHPDAGAKLTYMLNVLKGCLEASDIEARLSELERRVAERRQA